MILLFVGLDHVIHAALQYVLHDLIRYHGLHHNALPTAQNPTEFMKKFYEFWDSADWFMFEGDVISLGEKEKKKKKKWKKRKR